MRTNKKSKFTKEVNKKYKKPQKAPVNKKDNVKKAIKLISEASSLLGWQIVFNNTTKKVSYILLAEPKEVNKLVAKLEK